jgi:uncharacterized protein (DUF1800 family)
MATWNYENAAHLLRRAAFGGTPTEIQAFLGRHATVASAVGELINYKFSKKRPPGPNFVDDFQRLKMQRWWLKQMVSAKTVGEAFREKLTLFWHHHLASGASKQPNLRYMSIQNGLFRASAKGNFKTLVRDFNRDPANLYYLDGITNVASNDGIHVNANENFGREVLELFTLGVFQTAADGLPDPTKPNYTEDDVHHLSRACTGWTSIKGTRGVWNDYDWDGGQYDDDGSDPPTPDPVTIFGVTNNNFRIDDDVAGTPDDVLGLIFSRVDDDGNNQVGMFLARKLWTWYAYPPPAPGLKTVFEELAAVFAGADFDVSVLLTALFTHDEFYSTLAKSRTVKSPVDYVVGSMRALGFKKSDGRQVGDADRELGDLLRVMGMNLFEPPNVAGWPGGLAWINSGTLLARLEFARALAAAETGPNRFTLRTAFPSLFPNAAAAPAAIVDTVLHQLGLDVPPLGLSAAQKATLVDYVSDSGAKPTLNLSSDTTSDARVKLRGLVSLVLQSAEHQLF